MKLKLSLLMLVVAGVLFAFAPGADPNEITIRKFYQLLNADHAAKAESISKGIFAKDWKSYGNNEEFRPGGGPAFLKFTSEVFQSVPDLTWTIKEIIKSGNQYTVRSEASGTPKGTFLGIPAKGKKFKIMAIDIHTIVNGKIIKSYHLEDWSSAAQQLSAP
eukprot:TRINITY_DN80752_c0_g1_i1.p1 TRINITY_DN80752_c0_g1~~TRINITY_DN80752_c0_g1_i1.p1  ORF type:complete len:161 (+),score=17.36 TRINITY_DN80752_c0_g1_i1:264-746(+)